MKKPPMSDTQFDKLMPDALNPNGFNEDDETDWSALSIGSGVACGVVFILAVLDIQFAGLIFTGYSAELAEFASYFLVAMTIGFGIFCAYANFKARSSKSETSKNFGLRKA